MDQHAVKEGGIGRLAAGLLVAALLVLALLAIGPRSAAADHWWGASPDRPVGYHWARTANPFTLKLRDHVAGDWNTHLANVSADWSASSMLDTDVIEREETKRCKLPAGRIDVCNGRYGRNGWLGISEIRISGSHITTSRVRVNDTYFDMPAYDSADARQSVLCMEVGHSLGLDHQDGSGDSCMDDSSFDWPDIAHPNGHDYEQLETIYGHTDATATVSGGAAAGAGNDAKRVNESLYVKRFGGGERLYTWVHWRGANAAANAPASAPE